MISITLVQSGATPDRAVHMTMSKSIRTSVSLPLDLHETLAGLAKAKKVSVAWIIRDAAEKYVTEQWPLLQPEVA